MGTERSITAAISRAILFDLDYGERCVAIGGGLCVKAASSRCDRAMESESGRILVTYDR